ncbi:GAF and ANTAR domain-containing protein [Actinoplanes friuliensis]|uniref:ANTAR domain-containing protein n=1 Tax=Actinoplanes friuliensis DSM 7358 TaxID=1246995 RepID=U5VWL9_9ACTN|nr:ANTAR domain-containing protein [Actinoplanes friuliensis]AGZ41182.1 hypothetical protein AFR_14500 [Actinoplanes friuliensis DSM 7358]
MTTWSQQPSLPPSMAGNPLTETLIALAGTPDDASWIDTQLLTIAQSSADLITAIAYASVTAYREDAVTTVATTSDIARTVDQAQYDDQTGPCLEALDTAAPTPVPDISATMRWPGFRDSASRLGVTASLSIPLFAGRGVSVAALNLYSRDAYDLAPLIAAVSAAYDPAATPADEPLEPGGEALIAGLMGAFAVRARIQQAIGVIMATSHRTADAAYLVLRMRAAEKGTTLADTATAVITEQQV